MTRYTNTPEQNAMAQELLRGAREEIAAGRLKVRGVTIKAVTKANARDVFPPGARRSCAATSARRASFCDFFGGGLT